MSVPSSRKPARAVKPWTWARMLRDHGPKSRDFICAMLILRTRMDDDGFAYPGLRLLAQESRMAINTLRKHLETAEAEGWLAIIKDVYQPGQKPRVNTYRCAVPLTIELIDKDLALSDALIAEHGDIDNDGVSPMVDTPKSICDPSVSTHIDTEVPKLLEAFKAIPDEGAATASPALVSGRDDLNTALKKAERIRKAIAAFPKDRENLDLIARLTGTTAEEVRQVRRTA